MQPPITISIQGREASFHEIAAKFYYNQPITLCYRDSFEEVFQDLTTGSSDKIFVAVSNSTHGVIEDVKRLTDTHNLTHEGSYTLQINQHLIGIPGTNIANIKEVLSHPVALSQCKKFFKGNPTIKQRAYYDTAAAVAKVKKDTNPTLAAIGSSASAELYGLEIIQEAIQDEPDNVTMFKSYCLKNNFYV